MTRQFSILPGIREAIPLFIGLVSPSGGGKTRSAFELATGIQDVVGGDIMFINTEGPRGLADIGLYKGRIKHMPFAAPYASLDYLSAILQAREAGAKTIVIDSMSHEHEAEGGMLDFQDQELRRLAGDDYGSWKADKYNMLAWQAPKAARRKLLVRGIMQADVNLIACFRAKETSKPVRVDGKTKIVNMGFTPIAGDEFVFEMALCAFLPPNARGVPNWHPEGEGERIAVKRNDQLARIVPDGARLSQEIGRNLAQWARREGEAAKVETFDEYSRALSDKVAAATDAAALGAWWNSATEKARRQSFNMTEAELGNIKGLVSQRIAELKSQSEVAAGQTSDSGQS